MTILPPAYYGARAGDVVHVRSRTFYGSLIRRCLPECWGNHDATLIWHATTDWAVAEATVRRGFVATPWARYVHAVVRGDCSFVFMRPPGMEWTDSIKVQDAASDMVLAAPKYDKRAILALGVSLLLRVSLPIENEWEWYCTEAVAAHYAHAGKQYNVWGADLPTPYTTEKRCREGRLEQVGQLYAHDMPRFRKDQ